MLAHYLHPEAVSINLDVNTIFLSALFTALVSATARSQVHAAEVVVLLQLCWGFLLGVLTAWGLRLREDYGGPKGEFHRYPLMGSLFRLSLTTAICAYSVWFWFSGAQGSLSNDCPAYIFIFAKANIRGGVHILFQLQSALFMAPLGVLYIWEVVFVMWFYLTTVTITTMLVLGFSVHKTERGHWWNHWNKSSLVIKRGHKLPFALSWTRANGVVSDGRERPDLTTWIFFFLKLIMEASFVVVGQLLTRSSGNKAIVRSLRTYLRSFKDVALKV